MRKCHTNPCHPSGCHQCSHHTKLGENKLIKIMKSSRKGDKTGLDRILFQLRQQHLITKEEFNKRHDQMVYEKI